MINQNLIDTTLPYLRVTDTVSKALDFFDQYKFTHLPVLNKDQFVGLLPEGVLSQNAAPDATLDQFKYDFIQSSMKGHFHFLKSVAYSKFHHCTLVPVTGEDDTFLGSIRALDLLNVVGDFVGASDGRALIVLEIDRNQLSFSEINSIIENDGASMSHFNISPVAETSLLQVTIQINQQEIATIIATFERYEYSVIFYSGEELFENEINANYQNLMNYLDI